MKVLHRPDLFAWSVFDEDRNLDFHSVAWVRDGRITLIDPLPLTAHDREHLNSLGAVERILVSNSDHLRATPELAAAFGAEVHGPSAEQGRLAVSRWLAAGDQPVPGLSVVSFDGSKTPGELAFVLEESTLITGDLIRCHLGGSLQLLPTPKLSDPVAAQRSVAAFVEGHPAIDAVIPCDGWPIFAGAQAALRSMVSAF